MANITRAPSEFENVQDELRRTNEELVEAREFLENVLESSTQYSIIAKDLEGRIMAWNKGAARIYGYDASEVIGQSSDMLHVAEELMEMPMLASVLEAGLAAFDLSCDGIGDLS